ncbi:MAG: cell division protein FtsW [Candidatus Nealsonbacteria bacterium]|nr:cell division protein FtsW [Candidatus Nealsonbacteria bacterium]
MRPNATKKEKPDYLLLGIVAILVLLGIMILASVSAALPQQENDSPISMLLRHIIVGLLPGLGLGYVAYRMSLVTIKNWAPAMLLANIALLIAVFVPGIGISAGGASRWINIFGFTSFQPSEFLKLTFILYLAAWLSSRMRKKIGSVSLNFGAFLAILGVIVLLLGLQPNVSTLGVIIVSAMIVYFLAGTPVRENLLMLGGGIALFFLFIKIAAYRFERFLVFISPDIEPMGMGYQMKQALITVGSGGIFGKGLGMSLQRFGFLPQPMADSIFAIFSEETGFIGGSVMIILFLLLAWRGFLIGRKTNDSFAKLLCFGLTSWILFQAFVNMGAMLRLLPLTGIPLPFVSYGGSALMAELAAIGLLLNISKQKT